MSSDGDSDRWVDRMAERFWDQTRDPFDKGRTVETFTGAVDDYKEISGAKAAEDATALATKQYEEQKLAAENARVEAQNMTARDQVAMSQRAGAARNAVKSSANKGQPGGSSLGVDEKDFLGL